MSATTQIVNIVTDYDGDHDRLAAHFDRFDGLQVRDRVTREVLYQGESPEKAVVKLANRYPQIDRDGSLAEALQALGADVREDEPTGDVFGIEWPAGLR